MLTIKVLDDEFMKTVMDMYGVQKLGYQRIGKLLHVTPVRIREALLKRGVPLRPKKINPKLEEAIAHDFVYGGISKEQLVKKYKVSLKVIYRIVKQRKLERKVQPIYLNPWERCGGKTAYQLWIERYGQEEADKRFALTRAKLSKNNARYGKPALRGSGTSWQGWYKGTYFRSLKELNYIMAELEKEGVEWVSGEEQKYMVKYTGWDGLPKTYRPDFILLKSKLMVEIKPAPLWDTPLVQLKKKAAEETCKEIGLTYVLIDPPIDHAKMLEAYRAGHIKWIEPTQKKFDAKHGSEVGLVAA